MDSGLWGCVLWALGFWAVGFRLWGGAELPVSVSVSVQAEEFHALVHSFLGRLSEAEKTLKYGLGPPEERSAQQCQLQLQVSAGGGAAAARLCLHPLQGSANRASCSCRAVPALRTSCSCRSVPGGAAAAARLCQWGQLQLQGGANRANIHCRAVPASITGQCQ